MGFKLRLYNNNSNTPFQPPFYGDKMEHEDYLLDRKRQKGKSIKLSKFGSKFIPLNFTVWPKQNKHKSELRFTQDFQ